MTLLFSSNDTSTNDNNEWSSVKTHLKKILEKNDNNEGIKISRKRKDLECELKNSYIHVNGLLYKVSRTVNGTLGKGTYALVKIVTNENGDEFALKIQKYNNSADKEKIENEKNIMQVLGRDLGNFSTKFSQDRFTHKKYYLMPIFKGKTLKDFLQEPHDNKEVNIKIAEAL